MINDRLPASLRLQRMTLDDLPEVMDIERAAYTSPWPEKAYRQELANPRAYFDALKYGEQLIGYSGMWYFVDEVHLGTIVTHQTARRHGIGELLLVNIIERAVKLSADVVTLEVRSSNSSAISLYQKYRFKEVGRRKKYYQNKESAIIMTSPGLSSGAYLAFLKRLKEKLFQRLEKFWLLA